MTPSARIQAAIVILDDIATGTAAEKALTGWARRSRFAGSGDRAAIRDHVFQALRCKRSYAAWGGCDTGRGLMIGALRATGKDVSLLFDGQGYGPEPLNDVEYQAGNPPLDKGEQMDLPDWIIPLFSNSLQASANDAAYALRQRAPVMLRVNLRKATPDIAMVELAKDGVTAELSNVATTALLVTDGARRVAMSGAYQQGLVELQDGSSQAAMETIDLPPGSKVLDYCAGGGGKTLALAARAKATWFAHDAQPERMKDLANRAERAGVTVEILENDAVQAHAPYDLVLCDVPCSGSGAWRRSPDAKWRLTSERLHEMTALQSRILTDAAGLVAPKGMLIYATCSVLSQENEDKVKQFLTASPGWQAILQRRWAISGGGDGFFVAHLRRE